TLPQRSLLPLTLSSVLFTAPATPAFYTLSLHDALPIFDRLLGGGAADLGPRTRAQTLGDLGAQLDAMARARLLERLRIGVGDDRSEEHTSELQSRRDLVCRLLLEKKKNNNNEGDEELKA